MTYGLLNDITRLGLDITELGSLVLDPGVRNLIISLALTPRNSEGDFETSDGAPAPVETFSLSVDDAMDLIEWVVDHVAHFFMRSIEQAARLQKKYAERASSLMSSSTGFENSASKTPSAGPSDAPPVNSADSGGNSPSTT